MKENYFGRPEKFFSLFSSVTNLKGVGPRTARSLNNLGISRFRDLLLLAPIGGIHRVDINYFEEHKNPAVVIAEVIVLSISQKSRRSPIKVKTQQSSKILELIFFNYRLDWVKKILPEGQKRVISGKIEHQMFPSQIINPDYIVLPE
jgi:RecG-like helicase